MKLLQMAGTLKQEKKQSMGQIIKMCLEIHLIHALKF